MASEFTSHFSRPVGVPPTSGVSHVPDALPNSYEPATHSKFLVPAWHGMWGVFATRQQRQRAQRITERSPTLNPSIHCKKNQIVGAHTFRGAGREGKPDQKLDKPDSILVL